MEAPGEGYGSSHGRLALDYWQICRCIRINVGWGASWESITGGIAAPYLEQPEEMLYSTPSSGSLRQPKFETNLRVICLAVVSFSLPRCQA